MRWSFRHFTTGLAALAIALTPVAAIAESSPPSNASAELYAELNEAVAAEEWQQAITAIDRLIAEDPTRAAGLGSYREFLVARANAESSDVPTLPVLESNARAADPVETEREAANPGRTSDESEKRDRELERRIVRAGDRVGRRYSRDYREVRFWTDLFR